MNNVKKEKRPVIGVPGWKLGENSFGAGVNHLDFISRFGNPRILFPQDDDVDLDLLYLPGGPDLAPWAYGQIPGFRTGNPDLFRQHFYDVVLPKYMKKGTPIFGVCLGFQMLNVAAGGTLTQDLIYHAQSKDRWQKGHDAYIVGMNRKQGKIEVNSHHHQAVTYKDMSKEFDMLAYADNEEDPENCIVEAFLHKTLPIGGVQWHPEEWRDPFAMDMIRSLLENQKK
jgi:putative glutamine amidotransferase